MWPNHVTNAGSWADDSKLDMYLSSNHKVVPKYHTNG